MADALDDEAPTGVRTWLWARWPIVLALVLALVLIGINSGLGIRICTYELAALIAAIVVLGIAVRFAWQAAQFFPPLSNSAVDVYDVPRVR
jgi:hypothetical protein